ncbi:MAG: isopentenyl-diphosphate Delta-isomerase [Eubacteriales bacterium]|nr:isopentenyl-diphosphate Delta-isomerase [Eubacteriales bacterium]
MNLLLVDKEDRVIGYGEKMEIHREGRMHRAFSVFMQDAEGRFLIQKRADGKYHSGGKWSNSCCSHPYKEETFAGSVSRCISDELGIPNEMQSGTFIEKGVFLYYADLGEMKEHEIDHVLLYKASKKELEHIVPNPEEVAELRWMKTEQIDRELKESPESFSAWFAQAWNTLFTCQKKENIG